MKITLRQAFETLGVAQSASEDEARAAYRKLALQYHPDKNPHAEATAKFQEISASYKKICDFHRRGGGNQAAFFFDEDDEDEAFDHDHFDDEFGFGGMDFDDLEPTFEEMLMMFEMMFGPAMPSGKSKKAKKKKKKAASKASGATPAPPNTTENVPTPSAEPASSSAASEAPPKAAVPLGKSRRRKAPLGKQRGRGGLGGFDDLFIDPEMMMFEQFMGMSMNDPDLSNMEGDLMEEMMHLFAGASDDDLFDIVGGGGRGRRKAKGKASSKKKAAARVESSDEFEDVEEVSDWDDAHDKTASSTTKPASVGAGTGNQGDDQRDEAPVEVDCRVQVHGKLLGTVKFVGAVHYSKGDFIGVELDEPEGKNDGTIKGVTYFTCKPRHGVMVRPQDVARAPPSPA